MKRLLAVITLILTLAAPAMGLSDAEYRKLKKTSSDFRRADGELSQVWTRLKGSLSSKVFAELQKNQREWIRKGRDDAAKRYMNEGYSRAEAYTMATNDRAEELSRLVGKSSTPKSPSQPSRPRRQVKQVAPEPEPYDDDDDDNKGEIEEDRFKNVEAGNPEGNYSSKNAFMTVLITDKSSMEAAVTISINSPKEATWSAESWIDGDTLVLYDKNYSDCEVTITFKGNTAKVEASDTESWNEVLGEGLTLSGTYTR